MTLEKSAFDKVIEIVGNDGKFQKRFNFLFNFVLVLFAALPYLNIVFALSVPEHWCDVPGRHLTNYSIEEWKQIHIPKENDTRGKYSFSKCLMYNHSDTNYNDSSPAIIGCQNGWEFDSTWYELTAPSQEQWVCDKSLRVTNAFVFVRAGEVVGTFIFGQLADIFGRRPVFYMTLVTTVIGRLLTTVTTSYIYLFFLVSFIGSLPSTSVFQGPLVIAMEISKNEDRAHIAMMQCIGWTFGLCIMPMILWAVGDWVYFMCITTLPCTIFIFSQKFLIESPRWLASKGRTKACIKELEKIAKTNNTKIPEDAAIMLSKKPEETEHAYGILGLFSSWRLVKNSFMLICGWSITAIIYFILILNATNLGGNPYMNFFWQSLAELPGYVIGKYASDKFGRRITSIISFSGTLIGCIMLVFIIQDESKAAGVNAVSVFLRFTNSFAFYVVNLQSLEIYPTCIRQTGMSVGGIAGNAFGILAPYIVFIGTQFNATYPYIISAVVAFLGIIAAVFLPETLNQKLPETLADAAIFGEDQNWLGVSKKREVDDEAEMPLKKK